MTKSDIDESDIDEPLKLSNSRSQTKDSSKQALRTVFVTKCFYFSPGLKMQRVSALPIAH